MTTQNDWNRGVIEEFRNNGGKVGGGFEGAPFLLLHTVGAKSGQPRVNPVMYLPDGDRWIVFTSKRRSILSSPSTSAAPLAEYRW